MPRSVSERTTWRAAWTPTRGPSERGRLRAAAHRPLPSSKMATCNLGLGITVKVLLFIKLMGKKFSSLAFSRGANQGFHMIQILLERPVSSPREAVFSFRQGAGKRFCAGHIARVFQLSCMNA